MKFVVKYSLAYDHVVSVGIEAGSSEEALAEAERQFDSGDLWNNTPSMPLLEDSFEEQDDNVLEFECEAVEQWPEPSPAATDLMGTQAMVRACRALVEAYDRAEESHSVDWCDIDQAVELARNALKLRGIR